MQTIHGHELKAIREHLDDQKIVLCHGVFDILHAGHLNYFEESKRTGGVLFVSITPDRFVNKGPGRPYFDENTRARMLSALDIVDFVVINDSPTAVSVINELKPDIYVKGPDYKDHSQDVTGEIRNEIAAVESHGGRVVYTDTPTFSSSTLCNRFFQSWAPEQLEAIAKIQEIGGYAKIEQTINDLSNLNVVVMGETIIDTYRFVEPQNISSKSPSISAKFIYEENYEGGAAAIAKHIESFVSAVTLATQLEPMTTCRKVRYIDINKQQRMFEVTEIAERMHSSYFGPYRQSIADAYIIADFGHGLIDELWREIISKINQFIALNVQTNSSNYGFNPFTKHSRFDYLCIDKREAQVAFHDNKSTTDQLISKVAKAVGRNFSITLGSAGAQFNDHRCPAFTDKVVDATGAGDAYFAITSLLCKIDADPAIVAFIGNVFAGLKTKIIGNKSAVTKAQLLKACQAILK